MIVNLASVSSWSMPHGAPVHIFSHFSGLLLDKTLEKWLKNLDWSTIENTPDKIQY